MKKILYTLLFLLSYNFCNSQDIDKGIYYFEQNITTDTIIDTTECMLLVTECINCFSKSITGYKIIETFSHNYNFGSSRDYDIKYLDKYKKEFPKTTIVWGYK